jgi:tetratricopeptide (TPR) repeat protein
MSYMSIIRRFLPTLLLAVAVAVAGTGCTRQARVHRALSLAERDFQAGNYDRAEVEYLSALRLSRTNPVAWAHLGIIYQAQGQVNKAYVYLKKALELRPDNLTVQLKLARLYLETGSVKEGREGLLKVLAKEPENPEAQLLLVEAAASQDEVRQAIQTLQLQQLSLQYGGGAGYHLALATAYVRLHDLDQAEKELDPALSLDQKSSEVYLGIASLALARTNVAGTETALKKAVEFARPRSGAQLKYANFLIKLRPTPQRPHPELEAKQLVEEVTRKTPDYVPAWMLLAQMAREQRNFSEAESALNRVLGLDPWDYPPKVLAGDLAMDQQDFPKAIAQYRQILNSPGVTNAAIQLPTVQFKLARAYEENRDIGVATILFRELAATNKNIEATLRLANKNIEATLRLARINLRQGHWEQAKTLTTDAIKDLDDIYKSQLQPQEAKLVLEMLDQAYSLLAGAYLGEGNQGMAMNVYRKMIGVFSPRPDLVADAAIRWGRVLVKLNRLEEARAAFEKASEVLPNSLAGLDELVQLDLKQDDYAGALALVGKELQTRTNDTAVSAQLYLALGQIHWTHAEAMVKEKNRNRSKTQEDLTMADVPEAGPEINAAQQAFHKAIDHYPLEPAYLGLAQLYKETRKHQEALNQLAGLTNDTHALFLRGMIQEQVNQYSDAGDAYEGVLRLGSTNSEETVTVYAMNNLAYLYSEQLNHPARAYELATKSRDLAPTNPLLADTLGWIVYSRGDYKRALALISECAEKLPQEPEVQLHLGLTHYMLGDEIEAREALTAAIESSKEFLHKDEATNRLEVLAINPATTNSKAIEVLEKRHKDAPGDPVAAVRLARIYGRENPDKAIKICEDSLQRNPQNFRLAYEAARLYANKNRTDKNQTDKALALAKDAHEKAPEDPHISHLLGKLTFQKGDFDYAATLLKEAADKLPGDPELFYDLAWAQYALGKEGEALNTMRKETPNYSMIWPGPSTPWERREKLLILCVRSPRQAAHFQEPTTPNNSSTWCNPQPAQTSPLWKTRHRRCGTVIRTMFLH